MRRTIEITTSAYDEPYITNCMYEDGEAFLKLKWKQMHEGDHRRPSTIFVWIREKA